MVQASNRRWKTKPLDCWQKGKELRLNYYRDVATAQEQGKFLVSGSGTWAQTLPAGLGDHVFFSGEPYGASISHDPGFAQQCAEATEAHGLARDLCAYMRNYWGSMYLDRYLFGGPFPRPDFYLSFHMCDSHAKWYELAAEYTGAPQFAIDWPVAAYRENREVRAEYVAGQMWDAIEWMERLTGRKFDDEKLIEAIENEVYALRYFSEALVLNQAIPAPLDHKSQLSLYVHTINMKHTQEARDFYKLLRDEVQDRVDNQIASLASERYRIWHDNIPPWFFLRFFRNMEQYGAACVGSFYLFIFGAFIQDELDNWVPHPTPQEMGLSFRGREDALRFYSEYIIDSPGYDMFYLAPLKTAHILQLMRQYTCGAMMMHLNRGCEGHAEGQLEFRLGLLEKGIPVLTYEGNMADKREFDEAQVLDRVESFMESLGLNKLEG